MTRWKSVLLVTSNAEGALSEQFSCVKTWRTSDPLNLTSNSIFNKIKTQKHGNDPRDSPHRKITIKPAQTESSQKLVARLSVQVQNGFPPPYFQPIEKSWRGRGRGLVRPQRCFFKPFPYKPVIIDNALYNYINA